MSDVRTRRISRELFAGTVGANLGGIETWVTDRLTAVLEEEDVAAGDCIFRAGEAPDFFYFVRRGRVELLRGGHLAEVIDGPRSFGMLDGLVERPRLLTAYARTPLQLLKVKFDTWLELLEDSFALARMAVLRGARNVAALEERYWAKGSDVGRELPFMLDVTGPKLDIVERLAVLMQVPYLKGAGVQALSDLAVACEEIALARGERLFQRGTPRKDLFVVIDGTVEASRASPQVSWRGGPGRMVCGIATLGDAGSEWEARAATPARALSFSVDDWFDVMEENFEMVRATLAALAAESERLREPR